MHGFIRALTKISLWIVRARKPEKSLPSHTLSKRRKELDRLISDISRSLRFLSGPSRSGGLFLLREKHEELGRLLAELQRRMRMLDERNRIKYEPRAEGILADAAKVGSTLPPP